MHVCPLTVERELNVQRQERQCLFRDPGLHVFEQDQATTVPGFRTHLVIAGSAPKQFTGRCYVCERRRGAKDLAEFLAARPAKYDPVAALRRERGGPAAS